MELPEGLSTAIPSITGKYIYLQASNIWIFDVESKRIIRKIPNTHYSRISTSKFSARWGYVTWKKKTVECAVFEDEEGVKEHHHLSIPLKNEADCEIIFSSVESSKCWIQTRHAVYSWDLSVNRVNAVFQTEGYVRSCIALGKNIAFLECFPIPHYGNLVVSGIEKERMLQYPIRNMYGHLGGNSIVHAKWLVRLSEDSFVLSCEHKHPGRLLCNDLFLVRISEDVCNPTFVAQYPIDLYKPALTKNGKTILCCSEYIDRDKNQLQLAYSLAEIETDSFRCKELQKASQGSYLDARFFPDERYIAVAGFLNNGIYRLTEETEWRFC